MYDSGLIGRMFLGVVGENFVEGLAPVSRIL